MFLIRLTSSPHFYLILYVSIGLLAAFNIFEIVFLLAHKTRLEKSEARKELLKHRIATAMITVSNPAEVLPEPLDHTDYEAYSEAVSSILESFEGEIAGRAIQLIYKFKVDLHFQRLCANPVWFKRAHAVDILSALKLEKNRNFFPDLFRTETSKEVKYRIIYGLSLIPRDREYVYTLARLLSTLPYLTAKYTEDVFLNAITALRNAGKEEEFNFFLQRILKDPEILTLVKRDCLSACHAANCVQNAPVIKDYYSTFKDEPEIVIASIKTLAGMGDFSVVPEALHHKDWRVKLTALKYAHLCKPDIFPDHNTLLHDPEYHFAVLPDILRDKDWRTKLADLRTAHLGNSGILKELKPLLHDPNYHIRLNAALALSRIGRLGLEILRDERTSPDKFAAEVAKFALDSAGKAK